MTIFVNSNKSHKTAIRTKPTKHLQMYLQETQTIDNRCTLHTPKGILRCEIRPNKTRIIVTSTSRLVHTMTASLKISLSRFCLLQRLDRSSRILLTNCLLNGPKSFQAGHKKETRAFNFHLLLDFNVIFLF